tara:strand:+ start:854 stop:1150 length:297 start_codon:yes stop_codon:yes gene_type:complete
VKALKAIVIAMAVFIFIALIAVIWAIFNFTKSSEKPKNSIEFSQPLSLGLSAKCNMSEIDLNGQKMTIRTSGHSDNSNCEKVYIVDLSTGKVVFLVER